MYDSTLRHKALLEWLSSVVSAPFSLQPMASGAGPRRYYRIHQADRPLVVMDALPDEKLTNFIRLAKAFDEVGVRAPNVLAVDKTQGFALLTDLGKDLYGNILTALNVDELYQQAFEALLRIQSDHFPYPLKPFDLEHYHEKMQWFIEFFLQRYLNFSLSRRQRCDCERLLDSLLLMADRQPKVCVHYDYHCRNLIRMADGQAGVLDFQDAVRGPITYDLMSLLRDCYIDWPESQVRLWQEQYRLKALTAGILAEEDPKLWMRWCDYSSTQRHIKCIGLFARYHVMGHSSEHLTCIPRLLNYLCESSSRYKEMAVFYNILGRLPI